MRQRKLKDLDEKLNIYSGGIQLNPKALKGNWNSIFEKDQPIYLELGCGKGQFILSRAMDHPEINYIAIEGNRSVMLRALQKASRLITEGGQESPSAPLEEGLFAFDAGEVEAVGDDFEASKWSVDAEDCAYRVLPNLIFASMYLRHVDDCFAENELSGLYLNFSDPWPKERHAKRRLTHTGYLKGYEFVLKEDSFLEFKTDNEKLFRFSVEEFAANDLERLEYSENLHGPEGDAIESARYMTEYEEKFSSQGCPIYYCKVRIGR